MHWAMPFGGKWKKASLRGGCFLGVTVRICATLQCSTRASSSGLATNSNFFCFLFVKTHRFAGRPNQWPLIGETLFSSIPPSSSLISVSDPRRAFWADTAPFSGPRLASCVASGTTEIQGHRQVCRARRGGPRTLSLTTDANLDCAFVENALFDTDPWLCEKSTE